ncbi:DUF4160 domain-containing protein [Rhizobium tubonense]|uniref:DUF4160 domain-containing protein n=1 Tax=Rhizobium tubonense TaxID=484088 RepID=A0A2W4EC93_9HYPH|nr:DUF4160 domain-containing protein [Rhizobium tubonense]PZM09150.1 hypothetical protein CPY51_26890 [Rhizobium tubonense]
MVTIFRSGGFRVVIFSDDHEPAHVHVFGDGEAKINLIGMNGAPELVWADALKRSDVRRAMAIVQDHQEEFLARWRNIHG